MSKKDNRPGILSEFTHWLDTIKNFLEIWVRKILYKFITEPSFYVRLRMVDKSKPRDEQVVYTFIYKSGDKPLIVHEEISAFDIIGMRLEEKNGVIKHVIYSDDPYTETDYYVRQYKFETEKDSSNRSFISCTIDNGSHNGAIFHPLNREFIQSRKFHAYGDGSSTSVPSFKKTRYANEGISKVFQDLDYIVDVISTPEEIRLTQEQAEETQALIIQKKEEKLVEILETKLREAYRSKVLEGYRSFNSDNGLSFNRKADRYARDNAILPYTPLSRRDANKRSSS